MTYKIMIDKELCVGCGACTTCDNFQLDDDGKAYPIKSEVENPECSREGEEICPVQAIKVTKK